MPGDNRDKLQNIVDSSPSSATSNTYTNSLGFMNFAMQRWRVGLTNQSLNNMRSSAEEIDAGRMTNAAGSMREGVDFFSQVFRPGVSIRDRVAMLAGGALNTAGGAFYHSNSDINNFYQDKNQDKQTRVAMASFISSDPYA